MASTESSFAEQLHSSSHSHMTSSISSLSSQSPPPNVAKVYKHSSQLFLTRRVREALETLEPLLRPPSGPAEPVSPTSPSDSAAAPVAVASRSARIKVWSLYVSILNAIIEMGPEEGQAEFGGSNWKELVKRAREGTIWQGVVDVGYYGVEGAVDADVVANLATLLLAHAPSQRLTQQKLEAYLSASNTPDLDVEGHLQRRAAGISGSNGTSTPRDLLSRLKIIEIFTLHVLPRNEEWEYAKEFINNSEVLDDDRREAFLSTLQSLQDEKVLAGKKEAELQRQREQQMEDAKKKEAEAEAAKSRQDQRKKDVAPFRKDRDNTPETPQPVMHEKADGKVQINGKETKSVPPRQSHHRKPSLKDRNHGTSSVPAKRQKQPPPPTVLAAMQQAFATFATNMRRNPMMLIRLLAFMVALLMALSRRDIRDRLSRARNSVWSKVKSTVGMGVKVSYI